MNEKQSSESIDILKVLKTISDEVRPFLGRGKVADYIPRLAAVPIDKFGMAVQTVDGETHAVRDAYESFSVQSISKVFVLTMALKMARGEIWKRVGREPSGNPFNSLVQLEYENGIPRNPFINAGALVITDIVMSHSEQPAELILNFVRRLSGNDAVQYDNEVAESEKICGHRNAALASLLKSFGNLQNDVTQVLDLYFLFCSLSMNCVDLAKSVMFLANRGICPWNGEMIITPSQAKRINALMLTCGTYDAVGQFAYLVGLPGKSGVGGGIAAVIPERMGLAVWSPGLNHSGNSLAGTLALEMFTTKTGISIF